MLSTRVKSKAAVRANLTLNMTNAKKAKTQQNLKNFIIMKVYQRKS